MDERKLPNVRRTADHGIDALLPAEIAAKAEDIGAKKARLDAQRLTALAVLAGAFIALGAMFATTVLAGANGSMPFGTSRLVAGIVFSLGLILVVVGGAELFTGNALMVMALAARKITLGEMLRAWGIVYVGNFVGAFGTAVLVVLSGQYLAANGEVASVALSIAVAKVAHPFAHALFLGVLCNVLVCLAVWLSLGARGAADKILAVLFPVSAFVAAGFEHSVANMYLVPLGILIKGLGARNALVAGFGQRHRSRVAHLAELHVEPHTGHGRKRDRRRRPGRRGILVHLSSPRAR